jgi:hypothetical protein
MNNLHKFFLAIMFLMGVTVFHHLYGAIIYPQIFRAYVAYFSVAVALLEYLTYKQSTKSTNKKKKRLFGVLFLLFAISVSMLLIGIVEGGYNHFLKNVLFFSGVKLDVLTKMFPPPEYEMPDNFIFEFTGILQFVVAIFAIVFLTRHYRRFKHQKLEVLRD